jgi:hypothetical protein
MVAEMLDEHDRRVLAQIERGLSRQDPALAARMRGQRENRPFPTIFVLCVVLYVLLPMLTMLLGWIAALVTFDVFAVVIALVLARRSRKRAGP